MDSLENNISNNNKIPGSPGCDSFTRPEEISALSKFLSKKRKFLENNLELEDYLEDVPGKTTSKFHIIDNLEDKVINLSREEDVIKLSNKILSLDKTPDTSIEKVGLPKHLESIETNEVKELVNKLVKISENDIKDYKTLDNTKLNLTVDKEIKLDNTLSSLVVDNDIELSNNKVNLDLVNKEPELESTLLNLTGNLIDPKLEDTRLDIEVNNDIDLEDTRLNIDVNNDIDLGDTRLDIDVNNDINLEDTRLDINVESDINLEDTRLDIEVNNDVNLDNTRLDIEVNNDINLDNTRLDINVESDINLDNTRLDINVESDINLGDTRLDIEVNNDINLGDTRLDINVESDINLDNTRLNIEVNNDINLGDTRLDINVESDIDLDNTRLDIEVNNDIDLEDTRLDINVESDITELESFLLNLWDPIAPNNPVDYDYFDNTSTSNESLDDLNNTKDKLNLSSVDELSVPRKPGEENYDWLNINVDESGNPIDSSASVTRDKLNLGTLISPDELPELNRNGNYYWFENETVNAEGQDISIDGKVLPYDSSLSAPIPDSSLVTDSSIAFDTIPREDNDYGWLDNRTDSDGNPIRDRSYYFGTDGSLFYKYYVNNSDREIYLKRDDESSYRAPDGNIKNYNYKKYIEKINKLSEEDDGSLAIVKLYNDILSFGSSNVDDLIKPRTAIGGIPKFVSKQSSDRYPQTTAEVMNDDLITDDEKTRIISKTITNSDGESMKVTEMVSSEWVEFIKALVSNYLRPDMTPTDDGFRKYESSLNSFFRSKSELYRKFMSKPILGLDESGEYSSSVGYDSIPRVKGDYDWLDNRTIDNTPINSSNINSHKERVSYLDEKASLPWYKLPDQTLSLDKNYSISNYLRYAAEEVWGFARGMGRNTKGIGKDLLLNIRKFLLEETLALLIWGRDELEKSTRANKYRLPGNDFGIWSNLMSGNLSVKNILGESLEAFTVIESDNPINRPSISKGSKVVTLGWTKASVRPSDSLHNGIDVGKKSTLNKIKDILAGKNTPEINYLFKDSYMQGLGISTTLLDLAGETEATKLDSVDGLFETLRNSPYFTTSDKVTTTERGYKVMTLDSNAHWEIILEPYVGEINGWYTFLPLIEEINVRNKDLHNIRTNFNHWIPINSFELQKEKLNTKSLGLYDGEIVYPVSMEYTNELRMTIVDDQFKSWRTYFEKCAQVAIFSSTPNIAEVEGLSRKVSERNYNYISMVGTGGMKAIREKSTTPKSTTVMGETIKWDRLQTSEITKTVSEKKRVSEDTLTQTFEYIENVVSSEVIETDTIKLIEPKLKPIIIDKNYNLVSPYKNLAFRCKILVMTPQLSTINRYDLLLVLKDFSEERSGEIDSSGTDLNLTFSIVGENPPVIDDVARFMNDRNGSASKETWKDKTADKGKSISKGIGDMIIGLL